MGQKSGPGKPPAEQVVKAIRRATRRQFSAEEKIRIVLSGLRGEDSIAELCRREGIVENLYYRWSKEFLEAGKKRLAGDTARAATSDEVKAAPHTDADRDQDLADRAPDVAEAAVARGAHDDGPTAGLHQLGGFVEGQDRISCEFVLADPLRAHAERRFSAQQIEFAAAVPRL